MYHFILIVIKRRKRGEMKGVINCSGGLPTKILEVLKGSGFVKKKAWLLN